MMTAAAVEAFVASGLARGWRPKTEAWYRYALGHLAVAERELPGRPEPVESVLAGLRKRGLADATMYDIWSALRIFYKWTAGRLDVVNVMSAIGRPIEKKREIRTLTTGEVDRLLWRNQRHPRNYAMLVLMLDTGLRLGEMEGLGWADIEDGDDGCTLRVSGKTGERRVPVTARARQALERFRGQHELWVGATGPLSAWGIQKAVQRAFVNAGLPRGGPHMLRHTFGTLYIRAGGDAFSLQRLMGHASIETTRQYVNLDISDVKEKHDRYSPMATRPEGQQLRLIGGQDG